MVCGVSVFGHVFLRALTKRIGALFRPLASRGPLLRPRRKTQFYIVIDVRSVALFGQHGPGTREGCTFPKSVFLVVFRKSTLYVVFCVPFGAPGPLRAPSGGAPGAQQPEQGHGHSEASFRSCFAIRAGSRGSPRPRITTYSCVFRRGPESGPWEPQKAEECTRTCFEGP